MAMEFVHSGTGKEEPKERFEKIKEKILSHPF